MESSCNIDAVSELIARLLPHLPADHTGFVSHDAIVSAVVTGAIGAGIVSRERAMSLAAWHDARAAAENMVAWFSQHITMGLSPWDSFFDRDKRGGVWAYRPKTAIAPPIAVEPDLVVAIELDPRLFFHVRRERDPALAQATRNAKRRADGQLACEACGFLMSDVYLGLTGDVCEVHHRRPLAEAAEATETRLEDLAVLCPNCHCAIHRTDPLMSVEDFRSRFFSTERDQHANEPARADLGQALKIVSYA